MMDERPQTMGELAFGAYSTKQDGLTWDGREIPAWDKLGKPIQSAWEAAAKAVFQYWMEMLEEEND